MFTIVPRRVTQTRVEILVAAFWHRARPPQLDLRVEHQPAPISVASWQLIEGGASDPIWYWVGSISDLKPNRSHGVDLTWGREQLARARFETLPEKLPEGDLGAGPTRPFTLWLSSCFAVRQAQPGLGDVVEDVFSSPRLRPHINCHVGDQVYLDELWMFIYSALTERRLRSRFNDQYATTFTHPEFSKLLASAGNRFLADDHELWNNYPHHPFGIPLRSRRFWRRWFRLAYFERCEPLQAPERLEFIDIGTSDEAKDLSICIADLRVARTDNCIRLCEPHDMDKLVAWLKNLKCPGVLITQQPVISRRGEAGDRALPDYRQYWRDLLPAIHACPQDLVVLGGDVHHGFVARTLIGRTPERQLIQVVASPLALVNPVASSSPKPVLAYFPFRADLSSHKRKPRTEEEDDSARPVEYPLIVPTYDHGRHTRRSEDHAMTISFWKSDVAYNGEPQRRRIGMRVQTWLTRAASQAAPQSWETTLNVVGR
jgi:hypothetical protein